MRRRPHPARAADPLSRRRARRSPTRRRSRAPAGSRARASREGSRAVRRAPPTCLAARGLAGPAPALRSPGPDRKRRRTAWAWRGGRAPGPGRTWARSTRSTSRTNTSTRVRSGPRWAPRARGSSVGFSRLRLQPRAPEAGRGPHVPGQARTREVGADPRAGTALEHGAPGLGRVLGREVRDRPESSGTPRGTPSASARHSTGVSWGAHCMPDATRGVLRLSPPSGHSASWTPPRKPLL